MRTIIILVLIISLQSLTKADNIAEFEIEDISVGESLLDHLTFKEIKKAEKYGSVYPDSNYIAISISKISGPKYNYIEFVYNQKDKKYIIEAITGIVEYPDKYEECKKDMISVSEEFKIIFKGSEIYEDERPHAFEPSSTVYQIDFYPKSGGFARVSCTDWTKEMFEENRWVDNLKISLGSNKFLNFLSD